MSADGGLRSLFREKLRSGFHWQSVETGGTGLGIPDSNFCSLGTEGWIEFKQTDGWNVTLRTEQIGWLVKRALCGGRVFVAIRRWHDGGVRKGAAVDELWLYDGRWARELALVGLRGGVPLAGSWTGGPAGWGWVAVRAVILGPLDRS